MDDLSMYFKAVNPSNFFSSKKGKTKLGDVTFFNDGAGFPEPGDGDIAIIGVNETRGCELEGRPTDMADEVRGFLYELYTVGHKFRIMDLGNMAPGKTVEDTYFALASVVRELVQNNVIPVVIGGGQDLTYAIYQGYEKLEKTVNLAVADPRFDLGNVEGPLTSQSYLGKIILHQPNYLFNFSNLGYQSYFVDQSTLKLMDGLYFDHYRLGEVRANIRDAEPIIRNADIFSVDMSAVRQSDAPAAIKASPHGFYGEELCQLCRYAGMSDKLTSIGFFQADERKDKEGHTAHLMAQMIWHFAEGMSSRKKDFPVGSKEDYLKYRVALKDNEEELVFLKSPKSDRWWMEVPYPLDHKLRFQRHSLVPCSYTDYEQAMKDELPDLWFRTIKKLG